MFVLSLAFVLFVSYVPHIKCAPTQATNIKHTSQSTTSSGVANTAAAPTAAPATTENATALAVDSLIGGTEPSAGAKSENGSGKTPVDKVREFQTYSTVSQNVQVEELTADDQTVTEVTRDVSRYNSASQKQRIATGTAATDQGSRPVVVQMVLE